MGRGNHLLGERRNVIVAKIASTDGTPGKSLGNAYEALCSRLNTRRESQEMSNEARGSGAHRMR